MMMNHICPNCQFPLNENSYFKKYMCPKCGYSEPIEDSEPVEYNENIEDVEAVSENSEVIETIEESEPEDTSSFETTPTPVIKKEPVCDYIQSIHKCPRCDYPLNFHIHFNKHMCPKCGYYPTDEEEANFNTPAHQQQFHSSQPSPSAPVAAGAFDEVRFDKPEPNTTEQHSLTESDIESNFKSLRKKVTFYSALQIFVTIVLLSGVVSNFKIFLELKEKSQNVSQTPVIQQLEGVNSNINIPQIVENAMPSLVAITNKSTYTYHSWFYGTQSQEVEGSGTGVIVKDIDNNIYIATNYHVVSSANSLIITFIDESTVEASIVNYDEKRDIAVIKVNKANLSVDTIDNIKVINLGDSSKLKLGEDVVAIGNALGYGQSVTNGIISATNRVIKTQNTPDEDDFYSYFFGEYKKTKSTEDTSFSYLQTNAAINPGNSGGALLNAQGELIGINSAKASSVEVEGMGYAIPINEVKEFLNSSIDVAVASATKGSAYLGITGWDVTAEMAIKYGVQMGACVQEAKDEPAKSSLHSGDIIIGFNGEKVSSMNDLKHYLSQCLPDDKVTLDILTRTDAGYEEKTIEIVLGKAKE